MPLRRPLPQATTGSMMKARVFVTLKPSVFDPQGQTIADALHSMGYTASATCGRASTSSSSWPPTSPSRRGRWRREVADKLLANPVIESYRIEIEP